MPIKQQTHIDKALTNMSLQYIQDPSVYISDIVFPRIPVQQQTGLYFEYLRDDWFRDEAKERAIGTKSVGTDYELSQRSYHTKRYAIHKDIFDEERVNSDTPLAPDRDAVAFIWDKIRLNKENNWAREFFGTGIWQTDFTGIASGTPGANQVIQWDNYASSDPIGDIADAATAMQAVTAKRPNTLVLSRRVYDKLRQHPDILDRIKYTQRGVVTTELLAALFDIDRILVANAVQNTARRGEEIEMDFIMPDGALLLYVAPNPGLRTASAGYTFTWTGLMGANALGGRIIRLPMPQLGLGTERIEGECAYQHQAIAADLGIFYSNIVSPAT